MKRINYFSLILPILYITYSWIRLVIYIECHGYVPTDGRIMWWNSYKILNPYLHPVLAPLIVVFSGVGIYGISTLVAYLSLFSLKNKNKKTNLR